MAMLNVFKKIITEYKTPAGTSLQRHLTTYLSKQIDFLTSCRVLAASMKSAIRFLKYQISILNIDLPDSDAKVCLYVWLADFFIQTLLCEEIENYMFQKIVSADRIIVTNCVNNLHDGDVILTHGRSSV